MKSRQLLLIGMSIMAFGSLYAQNTACACCTEKHREFDFWIGEWTVTDTSGREIGTNRIEKTQNDCVLQEHWKGSSGSTGISMNFYNSQTGNWEQLWVDNQGTHLKLTGNREGDRMILSSGEFKHTDGKVYKNRITWTHNTDGSVRQLWEFLGADGAVQGVFDGLYTKKDRHRPRWIKKDRRAVGLFLG